MILTDLIAIKEKEIAGRKKIVLRCCMAAGCMSSDSKGVKEQLEKAVADAGLQNEVEVRGVGCMKLCCEGPLVAVDPQNALYVKVTAENAPSIIAALKGGKTNVPQADPEFGVFCETAFHRAREQRHRGSRAHRKLHRGGWLPGLARGAA